MIIINKSNDDKILAFERDKKVWSLKVLHNVNILFAYMEEYRMTSKQRAYLKSLGSVLDPAFQLGKASLTPEFTNAILEYFNTHELIKIAVLKNCADDPKEIAIMLAERTNSELVHVIGKKIVLYKPDKDEPKIVLPK